MTAPLSSTQPGAGDASPEDGVCAAAASSTAVYRALLGATDGTFGAAGPAAALPTPVRSTAGRPADGVLGAPVLLAVLPAAVRRALTGATHRTLGAARDLAPAAATVRHAPEPTPLAAGAARMLAYQLI